jgi:tetratricopeptide (TPR) repeat protein
MPEPADETAVQLQRQGAQLRKQARYADAERCLLRALDLQHDFAAAHLELGRAYRDQQRLEDAADYLQLAVHFAPDLAAAWLELGFVLGQLGRDESALTASRRATELAPDDCIAWLGLGNLFKARDDWNRAVEFYQIAVACDSHSAEAQYRLGYALYKTGLYAESRQSFDAALAASPNMIQAHHNLGLMLLETGHAEEALASFRRVLALNPQIAETRACLAHALRDLERLDEAILIYDELLAIEPTFSDAVINRSYALLMKGDFAGGWAAFEGRFGYGGQVGRNFPYPPWKGQSLAGKRLLVYAEQGLGDEIMFASCVNDVLLLASHCVIECNTRLAGLFQRSFPDAHVHGDAKNADQHWLNALPAIDYQVAIGSLPYHFRTEASSFSPRAGYLVASAPAVSRWRETLGSTGKVRVGIAWRGGSLRSRQFIRSIPLPLWEPLLRSDSVECYALQYGEIAGELRELHTHSRLPIKDLGAAIDDFDELAAIISALDIVISVDNTVAHLAGALGKNVWTLLPQCCEWRYPRSGTTMPWYPSMRLFRRMAGEGWEAVLDRVALALAGTFGLSTR